MFKLQYMSNSSKLCPTHFSRAAKNLQGENLPLRHPWLRAWIDLRDVCWLVYACSFTVIPYHSENHLGDVDWAMIRKAAVIIGICVNTKQLELFFKIKRSSYDAGSLKLRLPNFAAPSNEWKLWCTAEMSGVTFFRLRLHSCSTL